MNTAIPLSLHRHGDDSEALVRQVFKTLMPIQVLSAATPTLTSILTGILIGNYLPPEALVALGFVVPLNSLLGALSAIVSSGARILCGRYIGRGEIKKLDYAFAASMISLVALGVVLTLVMLFMPSSLASLLGAEGTAVAATAEYIRGLGIGIIPLLVVPCLMVFLQMEDDSVYALLATVVLAVCSLLFGIINLRLFDGSIFGMGIASSVSQFVTLIFLGVHIARSKTLMKFDMKGVSMKLVRRMVVIGFPAAFCMILYSLRNMALNTFALRFGGDTSVAALAILNSVAGPFDAVNVGFGAVVLMFGSVIVGERNNELLKALFKTSLKLGIIICGIKGIVFAALSKPFAILFGAEGALVGEATLLLALYATTMPLNAITQTFVATYQNLGKLRYINVLYIFSCIVFPLCCSMLLGPVFGSTGVWLCFGISEFLAVTVLFTVPWIKLRRISLDPQRLLMLEEKGSDAPKLSIPISTLSEAIGSSEAVVEFCKANGVDSRRCMLSGLCCEEMAVNVVTHGFKKSSKKDLAVEIFALIEDGGVTLRIMDNAVRFDPAEKLKYTDPDDPCKNIGIRMVSKIADDMEYRSTFGMNVLRIKL